MGFATVVGVAAAGMQSGYANTLHFPQVAVGGGYSRTFVIMNTGTNAVTGAQFFF